jgi:hypothetical protein
MDHGRRVEAHGIPLAGSLTGRHRHDVARLLPLLDGARLHTCYEHRADVHVGQLQFARDLICQRELAKCF